VKRLLSAVLLALGGATLAAAQVPPGPPPGQMPPSITIDMVRAAFVAQSGSDKVFFAGDGYGLDAAAQATLTAQARWLRVNPGIAVRIEGHSDARSTRDHALAIGERRADAVRDFLVLQGVPAAQISIISWGRERPAVEGPSENSLALNRRAVTVLMPPGAATPF